MKPILFFPCVVTEQRVRRCCVRGVPLQRSKKNDRSDPHSTTQWLTLFHWIYTIIEIGGGIINFLDLMIPIDVGSHKFRTWEAHIYGVHYSLYPAVHKCTASDYMICNAYDLPPRFVPLTREAFNDKIDQCDCKRSFWIFILRYIGRRSESSHSLLPEI